MKRIGFNVLGQFLNPVQRAAYLNFVAQDQPRVMTVMDEVSLAYATREASQGETLVIHRQYHKHDAAYWRWLSVNEYCDMVTMHGTISRDIWIQVLNEPDTKGDDLPDLVQWLVYVGDELADRGYHAVMGNIGPGTVEPETIESGVFEPYLRRLAEWSAAGRHYAGYHEYTGILLPFGVGYWPVAYLENPTLVQPYSWPILSAMATTFLREETLEKTRRPEAQVDQYPHYWHLLRSEWFNLWAEEQGIERHKIILTEFGWDRMPDLTKEMPTNVYQRLEQQWGAVGHFEVRGPRTLENVWRAYWPSWSFDEAAFRQLEWADGIYPENYIGMCLFGWTFDGHLDEKEENWERLGYNLGDLTDLQARLITAGAELPSPDPLPVPEPEPTPEPVGCSPVGWVMQLVSNMRTRQASSLRITQMKVKESLVDLKISQRLVWSGLMVLLFLIGAFLGNPGEFPVNEDGTLITPELVLELLAPLGMLAGISVFLTKSIKQRVDSGQIKAGDVMALFKMEDFWVALIGSIAGIAQLFNFELLDEATQAMLVNAIMAVVTLLLRDYAQRAPGVETQIAFKLPDPTAGDELTAFRRVDVGS